MPQVPVVNFNPVGGTYTTSRGEFGFRAICPDPGASIAWTDDGTIPVPMGHGNQTGSAFGYIFRGVNQTITKTIKAVAYKTGYTNSALVTQVYVVTFTPIQPPPRPLGPPGLTPPSGSNLTFPIDVIISLGTSGQFIIYTENDGDPTLINGVQAPDGNVTVTLTADTVLRAICARHDQTQVSSITIGNYIGHANTIPVPTFTPPSQVNVTFPFNVAIATSDLSAVIIWTDDETIPTWNNGTHAPSPVNLTLLQNTNLMAVAAEDQSHISDVGTGSYTGPVQPPPPVFFGAEGDIIVIVSDQDTIFGGVIVNPVAMPSTLPPIQPPIVTTALPGAAGMIYRPEITSLTGSPPSLQSFPSAPLMLETLIKITIGTGEQSWRVDPGAADPADPGQIAPSDFNASTNSKHYTRVL